MDGWISIHRKLLTWEWYTISPMVHLAMHLLLKANHAPKVWKDISLNRGELVTGRKQLCTETGISEQTIRTCLTRLKKSHFLTTKTTSRFTIITISNYDTYQSQNTCQQPAVQPTTNQQLTSNQPATNQQLTTNNNDNKENNDNNDNNDNNREIVEAENSKKIDFKKIETAFTELCPAMPRVKRMHETRKKAIRQHISNEGEAQLLEVFRLAGQSDFLTGKNDRGWTADFDWILKPQNFYKILEGKYKNPTQHGKLKPNDPRASESAGWGIPL